jgi:hypothetical protein
MISGKQAIHSDILFLAPLPSSSRQPWAACTFILASWTLVNAQGPLATRISISANQLIGPEYDDKYIYGKAQQLAAN